MSSTNRHVPSINNNPTLLSPTNTFPSILETTMHYKSFTNRIKHIAKALREEGPGFSVIKQYRMRRRDKLFVNHFTNFTKINVELTKCQNQK